jgi:hypothetical protein
MSAPDVEILNEWVSTGLMNETKVSEYVTASASVYVAVIAAIIGYILISLALIFCSNSEQCRQWANYTLVTLGSLELNSLV